MIKVGNNNIKEVKVGNTSIGKVYKGSDLIHQNNRPTFVFTVVSRSENFSYKINNVSKTISAEAEMPITIEETIEGDNISLKRMFYNAVFKSIVFNSFNTNKVTNMSNMIACYNLTLLDISKLVTSNVTNMFGMFANCYNLESLDLSSFDTSNVTNMNQMFIACTSLTSLDLSNFDTSKVTFMTGMFKDCNKLKYIKCKQAFKDWCIANQDTIYLPTAMRKNGSGTWEIVD